MSDLVPGIPATSPARIHADRSAGTLDIAWGDGHLTTYTALALRWMCPCAFCRGEAGLPGWLDSAPTLTDTQTRITGLALVGRYAVQPTWADGHATGFYAFTSLRAQCPCPDCSARRGTPGAGSAHMAHAAAGHAGVAAAGATSAGASTAAVASSQGHADHGHEGHGHEGHDHAGHDHGGTAG